MTILVDLPGNFGNQLFISAASLSGFAVATGASVIADGVETAEELATLRSLGITHAQGYHLAKPTASRRCKAGTSSAR